MGACKSITTSTAPTSAEEMRLCIVGQGPTAAGHGKEIDACDLVVRIKNHWRCGADDTGHKTSVVAHYGDGWSNPPEAVKRAEQWFTQTPRQLRLKEEEGWRRLQHLVEHARHQPIRWATQALWNRVSEYLNGSHPSTGMMAVAMAVELYPDCELVLFGYDSTTPDRPNFWDAKQLAEKKAPHDVLAEKRAIAELLNGMWLGQPSRATLEWPQMPELGESP
jgi:hypothetical protein